MTQKTDIHPLQADILKVLLFTPEARFSDLNVSRISTDHFTFHVKKLTELKLIEKTEENSYRLTIIGKEFANRFDVDTENVVLERQAKIGVLIGCVRGEGKDREYLIQQRLKQPYFGYYGFMTGKVKLGETVYETAERELQEEMGLAADLKLVGVRHKMDYDKDRRLLEDKYFYVFRGENPRGELQAEFNGGRNAWMTKDEISKLPKLFHDCMETIGLLDQGKFRFIESKYTVLGY